MILLAPYQASCKMSQLLLEAEYAINIDEWIEGSIIPPTDVKEICDLVFEHGCVTLPN